MRRIYIAVFMGCVAAGAFAAESGLTLKPAKDNFARSNYQIRNGGGSPNLYIAHAPNIRALIAFDLSKVTNEIIRAEFRFHQHGSNPKPIRLMVAPMVPTNNNAAWGEGRGNLGARGQNAQPGDSCYLFSALRNVPWESAPGSALRTLSDSSLWKSPIATLPGTPWTNGWVDISIDNAAWLEKARTSKIPIITFGLWGTAGDGLYSISSRETSWPAELRLTLKQEGK